MACDVDMPVPISMPMWRRAGCAPSAVISMLRQRRSPNRCRSLSGSRRNRRRTTCPDPRLRRRFLPGALFPESCACALSQHFVEAQGAGRDRALGVFHARAQGVAQAQLDRRRGRGCSAISSTIISVEAMLCSGAVAAHRTGVNRAGGDRDRVRSFLRQVVDRLRRRGRHHRHRRAEVASVRRRWLISPGKSCICRLGGPPPCGSACGRRDA